MEKTLSFLKATEGGPGQKFILQQLKENAIYARPAYSVYVGHTAVTVIGTKRQIARAERIVYGW
jgi:hypothetical protein